MKKTLILTSLVVLASLTLITLKASAYVTYAKWGSKVTYYINPSNVSGLTNTQAITAVQSAANVWPAVSGINLSYGGTTNNSTQSYDGKNNIFFRPVTDGYFANTTSWWSGSTLLDADIIVNESYPTFANDQVCSGGGQYIFNSLAHEFGHFIGLLHTDVAGATMYPYGNYCETDKESLEADDIAGAQSLYGANTGTTNTGSSDTTAPSVSLDSPANGSTVSGAVSLSATASDNVGVSSVVFSVGSTVLATDLSSPYTFNWDSASVVNGNYTLTATAKDLSGNTNTSSVSVNVSNVVAPADATAPVTTITSPLTGSTVSSKGKVSISANATDNVSVTAVEFYADATLLCRDTKSPYTCNWGSRTTGKTYSLTSKAYDAAGNSAISPSISVLVK